MRQYILSIYMVLMAREFLKTGICSTYFDNNSKSLEFFKDKRLMRFYERRKFAGIKKWMQLLKRRGVYDVMVLLPTPEVYEQQFVRVNSQNEKIFCEAEDAAYAWIQNWDTDGVNYISQYAECQFPEPFSLDSVFDLGIFKKTLRDIAAFAIAIGCGAWNDNFMNAMACLDGNRINATDRLTNLQEFLSEKAQDILHAATWADVFGIKDSWNVDAQEAARASGNENEYNRLTSDLYLHMHLAIMYAVNEKI